MPLSGAHSRRMASSDKHVQKWCRARFPGVDPRGSRRGLPQRSLIFGRPLQALERLAKWSSRRGLNPHSIGYSGAQSGHVYSESHGAERYNSRSSHLLFRHGVVAKAKRRSAKVLARPCGIRHVGRYISRPTRSRHPFAQDFYCALLLTVSPQDPPHVA